MRFFFLIAHPAYSLRGLFSFSLLLCRWFGIILLPIVSFSADATIAITFFVRQSLKAFFRSTPQPPESLAQARAIDMSIQFLLFWMPFVTLLGWWTNKPMSLLFGRCYHTTPQQLLFPRTKKENAQIYSKSRSSLAPASS